MGRKYYDDFGRLPVDKMAQEMSDMTYSYEFTVVPKDHYKKILSKELAEMLSNEPSIELNLLKPFHDIITSLIKENPKYFFKALLLVDGKVTYSSISATEFEALEMCWEQFLANKKKKNMMREDVTELFKRISISGRKSYEYDDSED